MVKVLPVPGILLSVGLRKVNREGRRPEIVARLAIAAPDHKLILSGKSYRRDTSRHVR